MTDEDRKNWEHIVRVNQDVPAIQQVAAELKRLEANENALNDIQTKLADENERLKEAVEVLRPPAQHYPRLMKIEERAKDVEALEAFLDADESKNMAELAGKLSRWLKEGK
jgi:predicted RNase H-like nuclease (RuvC/YqgF family)